jgi:acyl-CoA thioesterase-1
MSNMPETDTGLFRRTQLFTSTLAFVKTRRPIRLQMAVGALALTTLTGAMIYGGQAPKKVIVAFGDSYFSGYGLDPQNSFPAQFEKAMRARGHKARVINAGVPGETIADGLVRLDKTLKTKPDLIILELGANDAEQGLDPAVSKANLDMMLQRIKAAHVRVLLCGAVAPASFGEEYQASFDPIYPDMAAKHRVPLYPSILEGVSSDSSLIQDDGEHPNQHGVEVMVDRMLPVVEQALHQKQH